MKQKKKPLTTDGLVYSTDPQFKPSVESPEEQETLPPAQQVLKIQLETKHRAGKTATVVFGFIGKEEDLEILGKQLKSHCGTGGSVKEGEIIIQGDHREKIRAYLAKAGYKTKG
jgi:translation initiation factor 1